MLNQIYYMDNSPRLPLFYFYKQKVLLLRVKFANFAFKINTYRNSFSRSTHLYLSCANRKKEPSITTNHQKL